MTELAPVIQISSEILEGAIQTSSGPLGLVIIGVYSFLIAVILPFPSEIVLAAPIDLGFGRLTNFMVIVLVSGIGKAAGSVMAFHIGQELKQSGPVLGFFHRLGLDVEGWSQRRIVNLAQRFGYGGLAIALSVPFFPDTISIYAFAILERDYLKFAIATFVGSVGRLVLTLSIIGGTLALW